MKGNIKEWVIMANPYEISSLLQWFQSLLENFPSYLPYILMGGVGLCIISLIFAFYRRYSRQNAELVEKC